MRKLFLLCAVLILVVAAYAPAQCQDQQIVTTLNKFYDSVEKLDRDTLLTVVDPDIAKKIKAGDKSAGSVGEIYEFIPTVKESKGTISFSNRKYEVKSKTATKATVEMKGTVTIKMPGEKDDVSNTTDSLTLTCVNGKWYLQDIKSATD